MQKEGNSYNKSVYIHSYDYFAFMVNWQILIARSSAPTWTFYKYNFTTPGYYTATWMYYKDELVTFGADMAKVRNIVLSGLLYTFL